MFLQRMGGQKPRRLILDIDPTDDPCHGQQQLALFNGLCGQARYLPNLVFERTTGMLLGVRLRAGNVEVNDQGTNRRFVVTNCNGTARELWPVYDDRGTAETLIDEFKNGLSMDRLGWPM